MNATIVRAACATAAFAAGCGAMLAFSRAPADSPAAEQPAKNQPATNQATTSKDKSMQLGTFSVSLLVKDLAASRAFYEALGFHSIGGNGKSWLILQNDTATIGLHQGAIQKNTLTFNPGWDRNCKTLPQFEDVRDIQKAIKAKGLKPTVEADESSTGPAFFMVMDPDGNPVLFDQHVARP
ncbi:MAG: VOC family protein [Phycisphaerales bacterium]